MPRGRGLAAVAAAALLVGISGCQLNDSGDNLVAGKQDFVAKCGSCHTLKRAGTTGVTGPNLDEAFQQARASRLRPELVQGHRLPPDPPAEPQPADRPRDGQDRRQDAGQAVHGHQGARTSRPTWPARSRSRARTRASSGPSASSAPTRSPRRRTASCRSPPTPRAPSPTPSARPRPAPARSRSTRSNKSSIDHDISVEGNGVNENGEVVKNGGVSKVNVDLKPGELHVLLLRPGPPRGRHGGQAHRQVTAGSRPAAARASSASYCWPARLNRNASANTIRMMSSVTIIAPASCWSESALSPSARWPLP